MRVVVRFRFVCLASVADSACFRSFSVGFRGGDPAPAERGLIADEVAADDLLVFHRQPLNGGQKALMQPPCGRMPRQDSATWAPSRSLGVRREETTIGRLPDVG